MLPHHIEEHALNAWPGLVNYLLDGTVVRLARGYTKRANSATPLYDGRLSWAEKIAAVEEIYRHAGQPPIFRLLSFRPETAELDAALDHKGYAHLDPTGVYTLDLNTTAAEYPDPAGSIIEPETFLNHFHALQNADIHPAHRRILQKASGTPRCILIEHHDRPAALGLAVHAGPVVGLFDIFTHPDFRRQGFGRKIVSDLLAWGRGRGATTAYLQVMTNNKGAIKLYQSLGFRESYQYWYRKYEIRSTKYD